MADPQIKVALLDQKLEDVKHIIVKIDDAIEKISEVNSNVTKMLAVHEERISKQEETDHILFAKIDKLRDKVDGDYNSLLHRIQGIEKRLWIAMGVVSCLIFLIQNTSNIKHLTQPSQSSIMSSINYRT